MTQVDGVGQAAHSQQQLLLLLLLLPLLLLLLRLLLLSMSPLLVLLLLAQQLLLLLPQTFSVEPEKQQPQQPCRGRNQSSHGRQDGRPPQAVVDGVGQA